MNISQQKMCVLSIPRQYARTGEVKLKLQNLKLVLKRMQPFFSKTKKLYKRAREANAYIGAGYSKHTVSIYQIICHIDWIF